MNEQNQNFDNDLFRRYLDGELHGAEEQRALHMIAENEEMREMLQFERSLFMSFSGEPDPASFAVPENFSDSVMDQILSGDSSHTDGKRSDTSILALFKPRQISIQPVYAAAAMLLLAFSFGYLLLNDTQPEEIASGPEHEMATQTQMVSESNSEVWIRFVYFDNEAESMAVAGDFSDWEPVSLNREVIDDKQVWTGMIPASRGEHHYMFVKDGEEWITDPLADLQRDDGFGNKNAVIYL